MRDPQAVTDAVLGEMQRIADATALSPEMRRVVNLAIGYGTRGLTAGTLARRLGVCKTSLNTRFRRGGCPSPRRLLADARLVLVAELLYEGQLCAVVAEWCGFSSPQALCRHVRHERGMAASALGLYPRAELDRFAALLADSNWPTLPLTGGRPAHYAKWAAA